MVVLVCIGSLAACSSEDGTVGNTELNVVVPNGGPGTGGGSSAPGLIDIQSVEYTINCTGTPQTFLDNNTPLPNDGAVQINGNLEVVDGRTDPQGPIPPEFGTARPGDGAEVWQGFMDLPVGPCTIQLRAKDNDGEVICTATESFDILPSTTSKVNLVMVCDVSFQAPVGMLDVDATFSFVVGNFCPDLFVLNCLDSNPAEVQILPPPNPAIAGTTCEVRARDVDSTCGQSCDPQTCTPTSEGLDCVPGPDPGVTTTVTCTNLLLDCDGDFIEDPSCTWSGDLTGSVGSFPGGPDDGNFFAFCVPPALGGIPGVMGSCTAVTTDGDEDCNKTKVVEINCAGLNFCDTPAGACDDGNDCTANDCDRSAQVCDNANLPAGTACTDAGGFPATCDGAGSCISQSPCDVVPDGDAFCDDGNVCTENFCGALGGCDLTPTNDGGACPSGTGSGAGVCDGGSCDSIDECTATDVSGCPSAPECFDPACDQGVTPYACDTAPSPAGTPCTSVPNGACDGAGACVAPPAINAGSGSSFWSANTTPPGGGTAPTTGGCRVFVTVLAADIFLDVDILLEVVSDGSNNMTTDWTITAQNPLLGALGGAAELGGLSIAALVTNANGGPITSGLDPSAVGQLIGNFYVVPGVGPLEIASPADITPGSAALTPTVGAGGTVSVNWDGTFSLDLTLGGMPLITVDASVCAFDEVGPDIDFGVF